MPAPTDSLAISAMTDGAAAQATDLVPARRGAGNVWLSLTYIKNLVLSGLTLAWASITGTPTTIAGYGITDARRPTTIAFLKAGTGSVTLTAPPAAVAEPFPRWRTKFDLSLYTQARLVAYVVTNGPAGGQIAIQYSTDQSTWNYLDNSAGPVCAADPGSATLSVGAYVTLNAAANADVFLRLITQNGNASTSFVFGQVELQVK